MLMLLISNFFQKKSVAPAAKAPEIVSKEEVFTSLVLSDLRAIGRGDVAEAFEEDLAYCPPECKVRTVFDHVHASGVRFRDLPDADAFGRVNGFLRR